MVDESSNSNNTVRSSRSVKLRRIVRYAFAGLTTTLVNLGAFHLFRALGIEYFIGNLIAILLSKAYAYLINKHYVFRSRRESKSGLYREMLAFICARGFTGLVDYFGLIVMVEVFGLPVTWSKYALTVLVIVLNYVLSNLVVFKRRAPGDVNDDDREASQKPQQPNSP